MKFCENCGSFMETIPGGYLCSKCGAKVSGKRVEVVEVEGSGKPVAVVEATEDNPVRVRQVCPACGFGEAFHWFGVPPHDRPEGGERGVVEYFRCASCRYTWIKG